MAVLVEDDGKFGLTHIVGTGGYREEKMKVLTNCEEAVNEILNFD